MIRRLPVACCYSVEWRSHLFSGLRPQTSRRHGRAAGGGRHRGARQRIWPMSSSLKAISSPLVREPAPLVARAGERRLVSLPSNPSSAGRQSPVDSLRRYKIGSTLATSGRGSLAVTFESDRLMSEAGPYPDQQTVLRSCSVPDSTIWMVIGD